MGQAKLRGTFEERKAKAIERNAAALELSKKKKQEEWDAMSPEEKRRREEARAVFVAMVNAGQLDNLKGLL